MQKFYRAMAVCALVLVSCQTAYAASGEHLAWGDFLLRLVNAAIFVGILWYATSKIVKKFFSGRRSGIIQEMDDLVERRRKAEEHLADVEKQIADVETECARLLEEGRAQAERMKDAILANAEQQAAHILEQAARMAEQEGKAELEAIRCKMADSIVSAVEKSLAEVLDDKTHQKLIDKSLSKGVLQ